MALSQAALAGLTGCSLVNIGPAAFTGYPGTAVTYTFRVVDDGSGACGFASGNAQITSDPAASAVLIAGDSWTADVDDTVDITVELTPNAGSATTTVVCDTCTTGATLQYTSTTVTARDWTLTRLSPPDGTNADAGEAVPLQLRVQDHGFDVNEQLVVWQIVGNPNQSSFVGAGSPNDTTATFTGGGGETEVELLVGAPNPGPQTIVVRASVGLDDPATAASVDYVIVGNDVFTLASANPAADNQAAAVGAPLPEPFRVVVHRNGVADGNAGTVLWTVSPPGAVVLSATSTPVDGGGVATVTGTVGSSPGTFAITATHADDPGSSITFVGNALGYTIDKPASGAGDGQSGPPGTPLPDPLRAIVTLDGQPGSGISVTWSVASGDAVLAGPNPSLSDSVGAVQMPVTLGTGGISVIRSSITDEPGTFTDFTVTATTAPVLALDKPASESGDNQTAPVNTPLPLPLKALATDNGVPAANVTVSWVVDSGSATLSHSVKQTGADGIAGITVTFGPTPGPVAIRATRADDTSATTVFHLTATPDDTVVYTLAKPAVGSGDGQTGTVGEPLAQSLVVIAANDGLPAAGVTVQWAVTGGEATLDAAQSVTNAGGRASIGLTFGDTPGTVTVTATRADAPLATSTFVLTADDAVDDGTYALDKPADSGDGASAAAGESVTLRAIVLRNQLPTPFERVAWEIRSGDARARPSLNTSGSGGIASTRIELGANVDAPVVVRAYLVDHPGSAEAIYTINGGEGDALAIVSGNGQQAAPGTALAPLVVRYTQAGMPVADAPVTWQLLDGDATLGASPTRTDSDGRSSLAVTLGSTRTPVRIRASAGTASVVFALEVSDGGLSLRVVSGSLQTGPIQTTADFPLLVEVLDSDGEPVAGQPLQWEIASGKGTLDSEATVTDDAGRSQTRLTFGTTPGHVLVLAYLPGQRDDAVEFDLTAISPGLRIVSGDGQSGAAGEPLADDFVVELDLGAAKALGGVTVTWSVLDGGGSIAPVTGTTDGDGRTSARLTLGPAAGTHRVSASIAGGASVQFAATAAAAGAGSIEIVSGNGQALPTQSPSAPLLVLVRDAAGNPLPGASVAWSGDNAEVAQASSVTGNDGRASTIARIVLPGAASVTASVEGSTVSVTFAINGGVGNIVGLTDPQEDVADAIDALCPALVGRSDLNAEQLDLRARCLELVDNAGSDPGAVRDALEALRQDVAFAQSNAAYAAVGAQFDNLKARIAALRSGSSGMDLGGLAFATNSGVLPLSLLPAQDAENGGGDEEIGGDFSRWGFFASGIVGRGSQDGDDATPEYDFDSRGLTAGVDYRVNDRLVLGASAGWNRQDTDLARGRGRVDTTGWSVSAYGTWYRDNAWYVDGVLTFGSSDYDLERAIRYTLPAADGGSTAVDQRATAATGGDQTSLALSLGRDFQAGAWSIGPYLRGTYTRVDFDAYSERLRGDLPGAGLGLAVDARELESQTAVLGGKASLAMSRDWGILMPHVQLEWEHEFQDDPDSLVARFLHDPTGTPMATVGEAIDTDYYNLGFGLSALFPGGRSAFLYYERLVGASGQSQDTVSLGVRFEF
ncbi:autotransporter domain-containing protein [Chiayiivirga flava]|uniref:Outer membrane autotransporter protein n=1 Tax=Chiayiivirga flava TaxID=659595 RepID=A0A7W8D2K2_9GAMM|nr:autotransporter domain-containing protein [Chiayiivirga flava]MBB5206818.1 outer membrane autotransporter protein [Chiayiivirga flava]